MKRSGVTIRVVILVLALALAGCTQPLEEHRFVEWRLEDDLAAFREQQTANPEHLYRVGELSDALHGPPYQRFRELRKRQRGSALSSTTKCLVPMGFGSLLWQWTESQVGS